MKALRALLLILSVLLVGCATHPLVQQCIDTTPAMSGARWNCVQQANAQIYRNTPQQNAQQPPAYDPFRAPTIVPMQNNGLTPGNSGMNCTPDGRGGYYCR